MIREIYGKKIGMTQLFSEEGMLIPTTLLQVDPVCVLERVDYANKSMARIGCFKIAGKKADKLKKPLKGYFSKLAVDSYKLIQEVEIEADADFSFLSPKVDEASRENVDKAENLDLAKSQEPVEGPAAQESSQVEAEAPEVGKKEDDPAKAVAAIDQRYIGVEIFSQGDKVSIQAVTKGRGFAGGMKRHGWKGQPGSHGSTMHRRVGSIGASAQPSRVIKGLHMPGHMGNVKRTVKNLKILKVDKERNLLFVKGCMPGPRGAVVKLKKVKY
jgi:large subunit ribosomal protein L3